MQFGRSAFDARGQRRVALDRIFDAVELVGEAAEIVEQGRAFPRRRAQFPSLPMRGDNHDCARIGMLFAERAKCRGVRVAAKPRHRGSVCEEDGRTAHYDLIIAPGVSCDLGCLVAERDREANRTLPEQAAEGGYLRFQLCPVATPKVKRWKRQSAT